MTLVPTLNLEFDLIEKFRQVFFFHVLTSFFTVYRDQIDSRRREKQIFATEHNQIAKHLVASLLVPSCPGSKKDAHDGQRSPKETKSAARERGHYYANQERHDHQPKHTRSE